MGTETRIGIVAGLLIVVVASVYFFYGSDRLDEEVLIVASPKPGAPSLKIPLSADEKTAPAARPAKQPQPAAAPSPKPASPGPSQQTRPQPPTAISPTAEQLATANGIDKYRLGAMPPVANQTPAALPTKVDAGPSAPPTLLRTSPSPLLIEATKENLQPPPAAAFPGRQVPDAAAKESLADESEPPGLVNAPAPRVPLEPQPAPHEVAAKTASNEARRHTIASGETLTSLARTYFGDSRRTTDIVAANPQLKGRHTLKPGDVLVIPGSADAARPSDTSGSAGSTPSGTSGASTYAVEEGDTFYAIARKLYGDPQRWPEIFKLNKELLRGDPKRLRPGMTLRLPD